MPEQKVKGGIIRSVIPGSLADQAGVKPGDRLLAINGQPLRDIIDYRFYSADEALNLAWEHEGDVRTVHVTRDYQTDLGIEFAELVFDGMRLCRNRCPFCFVDQMPPGLRRSLYVHDDDYRYSFLLGNYITLTNLTDEDWQRIGEQRLSPLYVSIHATDLEIRRRMLGNPRAPDVLAQLVRLNELGITVHGQVVIWPGMNDGAVLRQTIEKVSLLWPCVRTLALVPVGITRYQNASIRQVTPQEAAQIIELADDMRVRIQQQCACTWLYPADELYLLAGHQLPPARFYDDDAQWQNGVGMVRDLLDDWKRVKRRLKKNRLEPQTITLACGELIHPILSRMASELAELTPVHARVIAVPNKLFGRSVTVSGLLSAQDVLDALAGQELGQVFLPQAMFNQENHLSLDDMTIEQIASQLHTSVTLASSVGEVVAQLAGSGRSGS